MIKFFNRLWLIFIALIVLISSRYFYIGLDPNLKELYESFYLNFTRRIAIFGILGIFFLFLLLLINYSFLNKKLQSLKFLAVTGVIIIFLSSFVGTALLFLS
ncbi:hypothetical protein C7S20_15075 [Christiangramia fulva]|uniref:Uncharacterized protein n=1 Tax=Christiangramia fulva TaxID=2126553 RepID=A0A2R3Z8A0_9FLAO|nr:hypothetical protein C7S20_15075 [Christiangramia fulva]